MLPSTIYSYAVVKKGTKKRPPFTAAVFDLDGRGERIRTSDLSAPNRALYQTEPRPDSQSPSVNYPVGLVKPATETRVMRVASSSSFTRPLKPIFMISTQSGS